MLRNGDQHYVHKDGSGAGTSARLPFVISRGNVACEALKRGWFQARIDCWDRLRIPSCIYNLRTRHRTVISTSGPPEDELLDLPKGALLDGQ